MAGKAQTGPLCGHNNPVNVEDGTLCRAESPQPGSLNSGVSSALAWVEQSVAPGYPSVAGSLSVSYDRLQRGVRDDFAGAVCIYQACSTAENYAPDAILEETGYQLKSMLSGLLPGLLQMIAVVGASTLLGAGIGAIIGALAGGVGAAPGAVVGAELGFDVGMAILTWLGVAFLAASIVGGFGELLEAIRNGVEWAWRARTLKGAAQKEQVDRASHELARSVGILVRLILQAILAYVLKKAAMGSTGGAMTMVRGVQTRGAAAASDAAVADVAARLRASRLGNGFADWVERNWEDIRNNPKLRPKEAASSSSGAARGGSSSSAPSRGESAGGSERPAADSGRDQGESGSSKSGASHDAQSIEEQSDTSVRDKLERYLLKEDHPKGGPKAKWFREALGFEKANMDDLAAQIKFDRKTAVMTETTQHGRMYNQVIPIKGANGRVIDVKFAWIVKNDGVPRLVTAIPTKK